MATRNKPPFVPGIYFITFTILDWRNIFISPKYFDLVYKWFDHLKDKYGDKIYGYVVMPNHIHLLLDITEQSPTLPELMQNGKRFLAYQIVGLLEEDNKKDLLNFFAQSARTDKGAKHKLFTDYYDSKLVIGQEFFNEKLNYIHENPCQPKWQLVEHPEDYLHSSAANYYLGQGYYDVDIMTS